MTIKEKVILQLTIKSGTNLYGIIERNKEPIKKAIDLIFKAIKLTEKLTREECEKLQEVSDFQVKELLNWTYEKDRKQADIRFTSRLIRDVARRFERCENAKCNVENCTNLIGEERMCIFHITEQLNHERQKIYNNMKKLLEGYSQFDSWKDHDEFGGLLDKAFSEGFASAKSSIIEKIEKLMNDEPTTICRKCHTHWAGILKECETCKTKDCLEFYVDYEVLQDLLKSLATEKGNALGKKLPCGEGGSSNSEISKDVSNACLSKRNAKKEIL